MVGLDSTLVLILLGDVDKLLDTKMPFQMHTAVFARAANVFRALANSEQILKCQTVSR